MPSEEEQYHELSFYTLSHPDPAFIHQHIVDAFGVQQATPETKPIRVAFGLIGLYLYLEQGYTGREVQRAHMLLGNRQITWPEFPLPEQRGEVTVTDVLAAEPGEPRDTLIRAWCASVWKTYAPSHAQVAELVQSALFSAST